MINDGSEQMNVDRNFEDAMKKRKLYRDELMKFIAKKGSIQQIASIPKDIRDVFAVSYDITPEYHVKIQAAFQKYVDNAVSKTVTLPNEASAEDVKHTYMLAYRLGCKGISIYRFGSRDDQVLFLRGIKDNQVSLTNWLKHLR